MGSKHHIKRVWIMGHMLLLYGVLLSVLVGFNGTNSYSEYSFKYTDTASLQIQTNSTIDLNSKSAFRPKIYVLQCPTFRIHVTKQSSNDSGMWNYSLNVTMNRLNHVYSSSFLSVAARILLILSIAGIFRFSESTKETWEIPILGNSWKFLFQFRSIYTQAMQCYPSSIRNYFSDIDKSQAANPLFMNYEWIRLSSFKEFPTSSTVSTIRMAQSGFYYSGKGEEAICFCCGLRNDSWNTTETVNEIHRRLSPNCQFVKGEKTNNVAIHLESKPQPPSESIAIESCQLTQGASGGPEDIYSENNMQYRRESTNPQQSTNHLPASEDEVGVPDDVLASGLREDASNRTGKIGGKTRNMHNTETRVSVARFPGIPNEHPKHPEYAIKSVRLNSYTGWPTTSSVQPEELSTAGFYYAGINDCVRCFFCGGGIKNWEYGDSPWIEHARWFPNCVYVKQSKGQDFVKMCQAANANGAQGLISQDENVVEDSLIEDINSMAAVLVLDKGYTQTEVEDAIKQARLKHGKIELKVQHLLEFLDENNYTASTSSPLESRPAISTNIQSAQNRQHKPAPKLNTTKPSHEQRALYEENKQLKEQMMCKICMDKDANIVFLPCGHMVACLECAHALRKCAICRKIIQGTVRTYQS